MRRSWIVAASALAFCAAGPLPVLAQDEGPAPEAAEAQKSEGTLAFEALSKEMRDATAAWRKAYTEGAKAANGERWTPPPRPEPAFVQRFAEGAERFEGTEDAVPFLLQVAALGRSYDKDAGKGAIETLASAHADSPKLHQMTFTLLYGAYGYGEETVVDVMTRVADATPHADVKGAMLFARGAIVNRRGAKDDAERTAAVADLNAAIDAAPDSRYAKMSVGYIFELEHLQVGMAAPEIEGKDLDGVAFKLSDYRGKVVVLDFWGDW